MDSVLVGGYPERDGGGGGAAGQGQAYPWSQDDCGIDLVKKKK